MIRGNMILQLKYEHIEMDQVRLERQQVLNVYANDYTHMIYMCHSMIHVIYECMTKQFQPKVGL